LNNETVERKCDVFPFLNDSSFSDGEYRVRFGIDDARAGRDSEDRIDREVSRFRFGSSFSWEVRVVFDEINERSG
jgi:hypothetical protein